MEMVNASGKLGGLGRVTVGKLEELFFVLTKLGNVSENELFWRAMMHLKDITMTD